MNKIELKEGLKSDKESYDGGSFFKNIYKYITCSQLKYFKKVISCSRKYYYYRNKNNGKNLMRFFYQRKFNLLARRSNINIQGEFGKNLIVYHENIIVNYYSKIGDNVKLHGNNCIGNDGKNLQDCPRIGNNVDIGYGATIIGNIEIADNIIIGANSLVNKSFTEEGITIAGVPAKKIK